MYIPYACAFCIHEYAYVSMMKGYTKIGWFLELNKKTIMDPMV